MNDHYGHHSRYTDPSKVPFQSFWQPFWGLHVQLQASEILPDKTRTKFRSCPEGPQWVLQWHVQNLWSVKYMDKEDLPVTRSYNFQCIESQMYKRIKGLSMHCIGAIWINAQFQPPKTVGATWNIEYQIKKKMYHYNDSSANHSKGFRHVDKWQIIKESNKSTCAPMSACIHTYLA